MYVYTYVAVCYIVGDVYIAVFTIECFDREAYSKEQCSAYKEKKAPIPLETEGGVGRGPARGRL